MGQTGDCFPLMLMTQQSPYLQWPKHANLEQLLEQTDVTCKSSVTGLVCWQFSCARLCQKFLQQGLRTQGHRGLKQGNLRQSNASCVVL